MLKLRFNKYKFYEMLSPVIGFFAAMIVLLILVILVGETPRNAIVAIYKLTLSTPARIATVLSIAIPLFISGLAVSLAFRAGVFNIGVEGQYYVGGLVGALVGIYLPLPPIIHIPMVILFAMIGGALWALIPALLKVTKGIHEVISTIMFNSIALAFVNYLVNGPLSGITEKSQLEAQTGRILDTALFGKLNGFFRALGWPVPDYVYLDYSLIVAVVMGLFIWFLLFKTRYGFEIRAVGTSIDVSHYAGIRVKKIQLGAFLTSGALAGLIGLQEIFAIRGFYTYEIASGLGFDGIAIALIGRNSPLGVIFAALLFAFLKQAGYGLQLHTGVSNSIIYVITGSMILFIVVINELIARYIRALRRKEVG